ncbi:hypothetical protein A9B99_22555 [Mangrovibacter phragmitis]|uniref:Lipoprotein n=1 Tax=Mangrovibacter phragmitis TaxID=1691903 RepID=A0A1B7L323_9ENTR|nr:hypothetical protein [Mangrovibacter phragmitis]OAT76794.1 hypothetical protein A9B99_22555 [Mangrovibacter phragmitis]
MQKITITLISVLGILFVSGCTVSRPVNRTLSPPENTQWVNIEIANPSPYTQPFPLRVRYISHKCQKKRISGFDGSVITEPSYNAMRVPMQQNGDIWRGKVAITGGGICKWALSAITLGIEYIDATHMGKDLEPGFGVGAIIAFEPTATRNGIFEHLSNSDVTLSSIYYPVIKTNKMIRQNDSLHLFGKEKFINKRMLNLNQTVNVKFNPALDESKIVRMVAPEKHKLGEFIKIIYPDGTVVSDGSIHPDIRKMGE